MAKLTKRMVKKSATVSKRSNLRVSGSLEGQNGGEASQ
jgi:hypothetical protein